MIQYYSLSITDIIDVMKNDYMIITPLFFSIGVGSSIFSYHFTPKVSVKTCSPSNRKLLFITFF